MKLSGFDEYLDEGKLHLDESSDLPELADADDDDTLDVSVTHGDSYDPFALVKRALDSDFDSSVFDMVDDGDLPLAKNWLEFCAGPSFLNVKPFPKQIKFGLEFFADYCPDCTDPKIMDELFDQSLQEIYDRVQTLHRGVCPKCHKTRLDFVKEGKLRFYNELAGCAGQRSGKSVWVALTANYQLHRYLKLPNPSYYFNLLPGQTLHMTFVAITYGQAEDTLWQPFRDQYDRSPWFLEYNKLLDHYGSKYGVELYETKDTYLWYDHKRLTCYASGPDKRKLRGRTRFFCSVDELGWFHGTDKAVKLNPDQVCQALERSLRTIRSAVEKKRNTLQQFDAPDAVFANISSPSAANDKIMRLVRDTSIPTRYAFHLPTWEMNPEITRESLESEFMDNPVDAERDYGANPPLSDAPFISNPEVLRAIIDTSYKNGCAYDAASVLDKTYQATLHIKNFHFEPALPGINYIIGIDTGYTKNAFAVVLQHFDAGRKACILDAVVEIRPREGCPVHFPSMFSAVVEPLVAKYSVALVVFDKWQSIDFQQELQDKGTKALRYSLKHEDFSIIRGLILNRKAVLPGPELAFNKIIDPSEDYSRMIDKRPITHLIYQILAVRDLGRTVTKGLGVDDDIFRAWCLGVKFLVDMDYEKIFQHGAVRGKRKKGLGFIQGRTIGAPMQRSNSYTNKLGSILGRTKS